MTIINSPSANINNAQRSVQSHAETAVRAAPDTSINNGRTIEKLSSLKKFKLTVKGAFRKLHTSSAKKTLSVKNQRNLMPKQGEMQENPIYETAKSHTPTNMGYAEIIETPVATENVTASVVKGLEEEVMSAFDELLNASTAPAENVYATIQTALPDSDRYWNSLVEAENATPVVRSPIAFSMPVIKQQSTIVKKALAESAKPAPRKAQENASAATLSPMAATTPATTPLRPQNQMEIWKKEILAPVMDRLEKYKPEEFTSTESKDPKQYRDFFVATYKKAFEGALDKTIAQISAEKNSAKDSSTSRKDLITLTFEKLTGRFDTSYELPGEIPVRLEQMNREAMEGFLSEMHANPARGIRSFLTSSTKLSLRTLPTKIKGKITGRAKSYDIQQILETKSPVVSAKKNKVELISQWDLPNTK